MFAESFNNTARQQERRRSRQIAMQRMADAANIALVSSSNDAAVGGDGDAGRKTDHPVDASVTSKEQRRGQHRSSSSVASASNFLRETQAQHELEHPRSPLSSTSGGNGRKFPSLSNEARHLSWSDRSHVSTAGNGDSVNLHDIKNSLDGSTDRWNSILSKRGGSKKSARAGRRKKASGGITRLAAIRNNSAAWDGTAATSSATTSDDAAGAQRELWNALPFSKYRHQYSEVANDDSAGSVVSARSGRSYRDAEGERLLDLASRRLSPREETTNGRGPADGGCNDYIYGNQGIVEDMSTMRELYPHEYDSNHRRRDDEYDLTGMAAPIEDDDDDSFMGGHLPAGDGIGAEDDLHARRMRNQCRRTLKRPAMMLCATLGIAAGVFLGSYSLYGGVVNGIIGGGSGDDGSGTGGNWTGGVTVTSTPGDHGDEGGGGNGRANPIADGTLSPEEKGRFDHIRYTLVDGGASPPQVFTDTESAQYAALLWLTRDDPRALDPEDERIIQRYGLAVLWFGTTGSGYEWHLPVDYPPDDDGDGEYEGDDQAENDDGDENYGIDGSGEHNADEDANGWLPRRWRRSRSLQQKDPSAWFRHEGWLSSDGVCAWEGVSCHPQHENGDEHDPSSDGDVSRVELRRNNLRGFIPDELYSTLPYLVVLDVSDNGLAGGISDGVANMGYNIEVLNLTSNNIAGSLPSSIVKLSSLTGLHLSNNMLGGSIPHSIGSLTNLRHLDLSGNSLDGTIPYTIGQMQELSSLNLSWNLLLGGLPHEVSELSNTLTSLDVSHNSLGGPLIVEITSIPYLTTLRLNNNHFSGTIPTEVGTMSHLEELNLSSNNLHGRLPAEFSHIPGLESLNVANNHLDAQFPNEWASMAGLRELDVSSNELKGALPLFMDGMKNLRSINLAHNGFSGSIPSELGSLSKLEYLYANDNDFEGGVPKELGELTNAKKMALHNNYFTGDIDGSICKLVFGLFLTHLSADCGGETPKVHCECCMCIDH